MQTFKDTVEACAPVNGDLPLTHMTDVYAFRGVTQKKKLEFKKCPVFKEFLVYFFWGRAAYRVNSDIGPSDYDFYDPVCLVFSGGKLGPPKRIYPFDTGGFDRYSKMLPKDAAKEDFCLGGDPTSARRFCQKFFGSEGSYLRGKPLPDIPTGSMDFEVKTYHQLISAKQPENYDSRSSSVEFQYDQSVDLEPALEALIIPLSYKDSAEVKDLETRAAVDVVTYEAFSGYRPQEYNALIMTLLLGYLQRKGYVP